MTCLIVDDDKIMRELMTNYVTGTEGLKLAKVCEDPVEAHQFLTRHPVDLVFLDIELPRMSGFELLKSLDKKQNIIIITGSKGYAADAFEFDVVDYLLKPVSYARFLKAVNKMKSLRKPRAVIHKNGHIFIKSNSEIISVERTDILYLKSVGDYIQVVTKDKQYITLGTMKNFEDKLAKNEFFKVHRSFIVRLDKIEKIHENSVHVQGQEIPLSKQLRKDLFSKLDLM